MSGGVGFTQYATAAYTDNVLDDFTYFGKEYVEDKYGMTEAPNNMETVLDVGSEVTFYALEQFEDYPALLETVFGGSQRASLVAAAAGASTAFATGNAQTGLSAWYLLHVPTQRTAFSTWILWLRSSRSVWCIQRILN